MAKKSATGAKKDDGLPVAVTKTPEAAPSSIEVEQVLEHVSSPYRWELLEVPTVKPKKSSAVRHKSGQTK